MNRTLLFQAGDAIGLGHLLASIALYKHLADSLGWRFCCSIRHNVLAVDPTQDVDPFFETFFALGEDRSCLSSEVSDQSLERARDNGRTVMVACRSDRLDLVSGQHDVLAGMDFQVCLLPEFRDLLSQEQLPEADVVYIDTLCPFLPFPGVEAYYAGVPAFPPRLRSGDADRATGPFIGIHVRHGNGEALSGRPMGGTERFNTLMAHYADRIEALRREHQIRDVLVLSDNSAVADSLARAVGGRAAADTPLPEVPFQTYLGAPHASKLGRLARTLADFDRLSEASVIGGASSLFPLASWVWSDGASLAWIDDWEEGRNVSPLGERPPV